LRMEAMALMLAGRFEEALELMEPRKDSANYKDYSMLLTCYANTGRFIEAYHMAEKTLELNSDELAEWIVGIFKALGLVELLHIFPGRNDSFPQSVESPDERYPESDDAREMLQLDPESAQERLNRLDEMIKSASPAERAHAFFTIGELFFAQGDNKAAVANYLSAVDNNPHVAVYWGYAANAYQRAIKDSPEDLNELTALAYLSAIFARQAIELDYNNPRWHFYLGISMQLIAITSPPALIQSAVEKKRALEMCRGDQERLRSAIQISIQNLLAVYDQAKEHVFPSPIFEELRELV